MPRVLLAGAFGQRNPGDEALLVAFLRALPGWDVVVTSRDPFATELAHGVTAVPAWDPAAVARQVLRADAVVFAGGTVFKLLARSSGRRPLALLRDGLALAAGARALGRPVALLGVGADELPSRRAAALARALVHRSDLLVLRDEESAALLHAAGAPAPFRIGADPAWTMLEPAPAAGARSGAPAPALAGAGGADGVVVALSHLAGGRALAERLADGLAMVHAQGLPVALQPWQPDDEAMAALVAGALERDGVSPELLDPPADLAAARDLFAGARVVLGLRFHALVAAAAAGTAFAAVGHEAKLEGIARRFAQPAVSVDAVPAAIQRAVLRAAEGSPPAPAVAEREIARAEEGFRLLRVMISRGRSDEAASIGGLDLAPHGWVP